MIRSRLQLLSLLLFFCSIPVAGQSVSAQYTVTDLGDFSARALNNSTTIVGTQVNKAVLLRNGLLTDITPSGSPLADANGINDLDQIVGSALFCGDTSAGTCSKSFRRGFLFDRGTTTILGTLGGRDSVAFGINNAGQIAGWSDTAGEFQDEHAFIFQNGVFEDIGAKTTAPDSEAYSINATGQVSGKASSGTSQRGAFLFTNGAFQFFETTGIAFDINNAGQIVGSMGGNDDGVKRAFLFSGGVVQDLGMPNAQNKSAEAFAINNAGQVVGSSRPSFLSFEGDQAFIFSGGVMQDLNNLIPANSGWVLSKAVDINDAGQIVGNGFKNGQPKAFLLTPTQPMLITEPNSSKALVLESIWYLRDPFGLQTPVAFGPDRRTRLTIVARNIEVVAGENIAPPTVQAENAQHQLFELPVEFIGKIPGAGWLTQITVRLPDQLNGAGEVQLKISFRGQTSNSGSILIAPNP